MLRKVLSQFFVMFREIRQNDAGDALFSILECLPLIEKMFTFSFRYIRTYLTCQNAKITEASEGFINLDYHNYGGKVIGLQEALDAYLSSRREILMSCMCTSAKEKSGDNGPENYNKTHIETRDITGYPEILLLKIKGRENLSNFKIQITDSVIF